MVALGLVVGMVLVAGVVAVGVARQDSVSYFQAIYADSLQPVLQMNKD